MYELTLMAGEGAFTYGGKTYYGRIQQGGSRKALKALPEDERLELLTAAAATFLANLPKEGEVEKAAFRTEDGGKLRVSYYNKGEDKGQSFVPDSTETTAKVHNYIRASALLFEPPTSALRAGVGIERITGEQTCYANVFIQHHLKVDLGEKFRDQGYFEQDPEYQAAKDLWTAMKNLQKVAKEAQKGKTVIPASKVKELLSKAYVLQQLVGDGSNWSNFHQGQDALEFWSFVRQELGLDSLPRKLQTKLDTGHALTLQSDTSQLSSVKESLEAQGIPANLSKLDAAPKTLPLNIDRLSTGTKTYHPVKVDEEFILEDGGKKYTYRLVGAIEHVGRTANTGHYIAYRRDAKGNFLQYDDAQVRLVKTEDVLQQLAVTSTVSAK